MYEQYWELKRSPFSQSGCGKSFFDSSAQEEALARIEYLVINNRRLGLLFGKEGLGKSTVLHHVASELKRRRSPHACLNVLSMDSVEFVLNVAQSLGAIHDMSVSPAVAWRKLTDRFQTNRYQNLNTVLLIDDAHEAESEVLSALVRIAQWHPAGKSRVTVLLAADPDRAELIGPRLLELSELNVELEPWDQEDTIKFIRKSVIDAGATRQLFDVRAVEEIQHLAQGVPRRICQLAELALIAGAGQELDRVDPETVDMVHDELRTPVSSV